MNFERIRIFLWIGLCISVIAGASYFIPWSPAPVFSEKGLEKYNLVRDQVIAELEDFEKMTLFAIDPEVKLDSPRYFRGYKIIKKADLDRDDSFRVAGAIRKGIDVSLNGAGKRGFYPVVGVRTEKAGKVNEYLICTECGLMAVFNEKFEGIELVYQGSAIEYFEILGRN